MEMRALKEYVAHAKYQTCNLNCLVLAKRETQFRRRAMGKVLIITAGHKSIRKHLRNVLQWMIQKPPHLQTGQKICDTWLKQILSMVVKWKGQPKVMEESSRYVALHAKYRTITHKNENNKIRKKLKEKFEGCTERSMKVQIFTILPKDWSISRIQKEFPTVTNFMIQTSKKWVRESGIIASPNPKPGKNLDHSVVDRDGSIPHLLDT
ncbi:hypothetical protein PR048_011629 [Dryococelus australis]|uniref:Uncharacterized protein n=1 Tax=Dryococelus australis TaxID=614101 RepID=A0ABQ9HM86_9NEOP|nr:hypothetical protein PR048_011629 [Dryococelus australis]